MMDKNQNIQAFYLEIIDSKAMSHSHSKWQLKICENNLRIKKNKMKKLNGPSNLQE